MYCIYFLSNQWSPEFEHGHSSLEDIIEMGIRNVLQNQKSSMKYKILFWKNID